MNTNANASPTVLVSIGVNANANVNAIELTKQIDIKTQVRRMYIPYFSFACRILQVWNHSLHTLAPDLYIAAITIIKARC